MTEFLAKWGGLCGACYDHIEPGDRVQYVNDDLVHVDCEPFEVPDEKAVVCTTCWIQKPCECDDGR